MKIHKIFIFLLVFTNIAWSEETSPPAQQERTPFWRSLPFGSQTLNPDLSFIGDFLFRPGARDPGQNAFSFREAELGIQAAVDPYSRADAFLAVEEEEGKFEFEVEEAFLTLLKLPFRTQAKLGRFLVDFGRTHRTHAPERDFVDTPLSFSKILGVEEALKTNGLSGNVVLPLPWNSYHELRTELGETKVVFGEEEQAIERSEQFVNVREKNFIPITDSINLELAGGFGRWQTTSIAPVASTQAFAGRPEDLIRSLLSADFAVKWKPNALKSALLEGNFLYSVHRPVAEITVQDPVTNDDSTFIDYQPDEVHDRGGFLHVQVQPLRRWYVGSRVDYVLNGDGERADRNYSAIVTFFPSEFSRLRFQWNRRDSDGAEREHRFFLQMTWALGPHRPHPF